MDYKLQLKILSFLRLISENCREKNKNMTLLKKTSVYRIIGKKNEILETKPKHQKKTRRNYDYSLSHSVE